MSRKVALAKTITWRIIASQTTFILTWWFSGELAVGLAVGGAEAFVKMYLYYVHERVWEKFLLRRSGL